MPSENPRQRLHDIRDNVALIERFTAGLSEEEFLADRKTSYAVTRALEEIISEASRRLPDDVKGRHDAINRRALAALGNVYRHEYEQVNDRFVWRTIRNHLAPLRDAVEAEMEIERLSAAG
jgi:uncharacterized protein with HEPN domain